MARTPEVKKLTRDGMTSGVYCLVMYLDKNRRIRAGRHEYSFEEGFYCFVNSEPKNLYDKIKNHVSVASRAEKALLRSNIDYLLQHGYIIEVVKHRTKDRLECQFNQRVLSLPGCEIPVRGFGSSDCKCSSHLAYFEEKPRLPKAGLDYFP